VAAAGRSNLPGSIVLPYLPPWHGQAPNDAWLPVLGGGRSGDRPHLLDRAVGRDPSETRADLAAVTTAQLRKVVERLLAAGQWHEGDPKILVVLDSGYDAPRIAHLLCGLPVQILGRPRSDRVMRRPTPPRVYDSRAAAEALCCIQAAYPTSGRSMSGPSLGG
jgi:hypothetical protein